MTTEVMETEQVQFSSGEQAKIERIKELLALEVQTKWQIGDLVLELCGPSGTGSNSGRLQALARELNMSTHWLAVYRITSELFPPHKRDERLPHQAYVEVQSYAPEAAETILNRVLEDPRPYTQQLLRQTKDQVLREHGIVSRTGPRLSMPELFANKINTFRERLFRNQIQLSRSEAAELLEAWRALEPMIRAYARSNSPS